MVPYVWRPVRVCARWPARKVATVSKSDPGTGASGQRRGRGRRGGSPDTRAEIVREARAQFAEHGYDAVTFAGIAGAAGVDPTLITHFFGSKEQLFSATLESLGDAFGRMAEVFSGGRGGLGRRLAQTYFELWETESVRLQMLSVLRSASTNEGARSIFVGASEAGPLRAAQRGLPAEYAERVPLAVSVLMGVGFARYVLRAPSIVNMSPEELVDCVAPALEAVLG